MTKRKSAFPFLPAAIAASALMVALLPPAARADGNDDHGNGAKAWSESCGRCHNKRSPEKFSDAQWEVIVQHMRVRANLTGSEARAIVDFLKSAN